MPSSKVSLGGLSGAFDDVHRAYKIDKVIHTKNSSTPERALYRLQGAMLEVERCAGGTDALALHSSLAALAGLAIRAMVDLE